jgi:mannose-6-phosphate isomerase-like protein (cupin superfamily)
MTATSESAIASPFKVFAIQPELLESGKRSTALATSDILSGSVLVADRGLGETVMHSHRGMDQIFYVLNGQATFYTDDDEVVAVLDRNEGILVPRDAHYWYESTADENLVLFHVIARAPDLPQETVRYGPPLREQVPVVVREGQRFGA